MSERERSIRNPQYGIRNAGVPAVILAGAAAGPGMGCENATRSRAMVQIGPKTMLQWVVDALLSARSVGQVIAVGDVVADGLDGIIPPAGGFLENLIRGLGACPQDGPVLVTSSDIPLVTGEAVDDFVGRTLVSGAEMCYPIIPREACLARYPQLKRTYLRAAEGTFTGGNMFLLSPEFVRRNKARIARAYSARKNPLALAGMVGPGMLLRAALAQALLPSLLPIALIEITLSRTLGGRVAAVRTDFPEIGEDVDKAADLEAIRAIMASVYP